MGTKRTWIAVALGTLSGVGIALLSLLLAAAAVTRSGTLVQLWLPALSAVCGALGALTGGALSAKCNGRNGLIIGAVVSLLMSLLLLLLARLFGAALHPVFLLRLAAWVPAGMVGGLWGVHRRK